MYKLQNGDNYSTGICFCCGEVLVCPNGELMEHSETAPDSYHGNTPGSNTLLPLQLCWIQTPLSGWTTRFSDFTKKLHQKCATCTSKFTFWVIIVSPITRVSSGPLGSLSTKQRPSFFHIKCFVLFIVSTPCIHKPSSVSAINHQSSTRLLTFWGTLHLIYEVPAINPPAFSSAASLFNIWSFGITRL